MKMHDSSMLCFFGFLSLVVTASSISVDCRWQEHSSCHKLKLASIHFELSCCETAVANERPHAWLYYCESILTTWFLLAVTLHYLIFIPFTVVYGCTALHCPSEYLHSRLTLWARKSNHCWNPRESQKNNVIMCWEHWFWTKFRSSSRNTNLCTKQWTAVHYSVLSVSHLGLFTKLPKIHMQTLEVPIT